MTGPLEEVCHPSMSQLKRWCFTSISWTPSFRGFFSSCTQGQPLTVTAHTAKKAKVAGPRLVLIDDAITQVVTPEGGPALATQKTFGLICLHTHHSPFRRKAGCWAKNQPPTSLFAGSSQSWERLKAKQQRTLEGRKGRLSVTLRLALSIPLPPGPLSLGSRSPAPEQGPHRSSHLIWTQPGLRKKDQGWYHFSTVGRLEQSTSSHRCRTCSLETRGNSGPSTGSSEDHRWGSALWCWTGRSPSPLFLSQLSSLHLRQLPPPARLRGLSPAGQSRNETYNHQPGGATTTF